jgi:hypothetical protein
MTVWWPIIGSMTEPQFCAHHFVATEAEDGRLLLQCEHCDRYLAIRSEEN